MSVNRQYIIDDLKKQLIDLPSSNFSPPNVGIYDEPLRCYKANEQWAAIIEGIISWLAEVTAWTNAEDDSYPAIQNILIFLEGVDCQVGITDIRINNGVLEYFLNGVWTPVGAVLQDCDDVEACLPTSPTIIAMNAAIDAAQAQADLALANAALAQAQADLAFANTQTNAALIQTNIDDIAALDARVTSLHALGSNVTTEGIERFDWVDHSSGSWSTDVVEVDTIIPPDYDKVKLTYIAYGTQASLAVLEFFANQNKVASNYQTKSAAGLSLNSARIGFLPPAQADGVVSMQVEVILEGLMANTKNIARIHHAMTAAGTVVSAVADYIMWFYEVAETITSVQLKPTSGLVKAFGGWQLQVWQKVSYVTNVVNNPIPEAPTNPLGLIVDFDTGYMDYELLIAQPNNLTPLIQGGGNLGQAAVVRRTDLATVACFVQVNLPAISTVTRVDFDYQSTSEGGSGFLQQTAAIDYFDSGDNLLHTTNLHKVAQVAILDDWQNHEVIQTYNNVAYIVVRATTEAEFISILESAVDNISVDYI